jgi:hypothetical protein|tara:strand:- start:787 stop:1239 length:453 start_codon:yes stop_codon:yes gene_type:complete
MANSYRTARKKIVDSLVRKINLIDGNNPNNSNIFQNAHSGMVFLDEIQEYPKVCVVAGDEIREYQPGEFKWRFLSLDIRVYVEDQDDSQEVLAILMEDIERVIDNNDVLIYDDTVSPNLTTTSLTLQSLSTDEGVLAPLAIGEMTIECRY